MKKSVPHLSSRKVSYDYLREFTSLSSIISYCKSNPKEFYLELGVKKNDYLLKSIKPIRLYEEVFSEDEYYNPVNDSNKLRIVKINSHTKNINSKLEEKCEDLTFFKIEIDEIEKLVNGAGRKL